MSCLQHHAGPECPCAHTHQSESILSQLPRGKVFRWNHFEVPFSPCDDEYLAAFSHHRTPGELAHLPSTNLHFPGWEVHCSFKPSPGCCFVPSPPCLFGAAHQDACVDKWQDTLAGSCDNSALCSLSCLHSLHLSPCGILGAVCGCLAPPAVEGEYCPWDRELLQSQWLQHLSKEEEMGTYEGTRFAPCPSPPRLPSSHLKCTSKSRSHTERLFL